MYTRMKLWTVIALNSILSLSIGAEGQSSASSCLVHRVDLVPCNFQFPDTTPVPENDQYGIYTTRIRNDLSCDIRRRNYQIKDVDTIGGDPRIKLIYSPGIELSTQEDYVNQLYVRYNIMCPDGYNTAFFNITFSDLEPASCFNPNLNQDQCVDYIRVTRLGGSGGVTETCGSEGGQNVEQLDSGNLEILFRTSDTTRSSGFRATVICLDSTGAAPSDGTGRRRRRDLEDFENDWKRRLETLQMMKDKKIGRFRRQGAELRFEDLIIPYGVTLTFEDRVFTIIEASNKATLTIENGGLIIDAPNIAQQSFSDVSFLYTFDGDGVINEFRESAPSFSGPGFLVVVGEHAYFTMFLIDPRGILPANEDERRIINQLTTSLFDSFNLEDDMERLCDELLNQPPINFEELLSGIVSPTSPITEPECPSPGNIIPDLCNFTDTDLLLVLNSTESSNLVIRQLVDTIMACTDRSQPGRIDDLLATLSPPTSTPPPEGLMIFCSVALINVSNIDVVCGSNRLGEANDAIVLSECLLDGMASALADFCRYPRFMIPLVEAGIMAGSHRMDLTFVDGFGFDNTATVTFVAPFSVTCGLFVEGQQASVTCDASTVADVTSCTVDGEQLELCSFPTFSFDTTAYDFGRHTLIVQFSSGELFVDLSLDFLTFEG